MVTDIRSKNIRLTIGGNDWSDYCTEATLQWEEIDIQSGLIRAKGQFTLDVSELSPLPSYRRDPDQWAKGTSVLFETKDSGGNWVTPRMGNLFIATPPKAPSVTNPIIDLECVCVLTLFDFDQPDADASGVTVGTPRDRDLIVADILNQNNLTSSLAAIAYPLEYPVPKTGGSWVSQAGELAAVSKHFLYQDNDGTIKNRAINLNPSAIATVTIGTNEAEWEPSEAPEQPIEELTVSSVTYEVNSLGGTTQITEILGNRSDVYPEISPFRDEYIGVISRTTVQDYAYNPTTKTQQAVTTKEEPRLLVERFLNVYAEASYLLVVTEQTIDTNYYGDSGELIKQVCEKNKCKNSIYYYTLASEQTVLSPAEIVTTEYFYNADLTVSSIRATTRAAKATIYPIVSRAEAYSLVTQSAKESTWTSLGSNKWLYVQSGKIANYLRFPALTTGFNAFNLVLDTSQVYISDDGSGAPPQTTYLRLNDLPEIPLLACVHFTGLEASPYGDRTRHVQVNYATSEEQLYSFGVNYNAFLWGRRYGWRVGAGIIDALLTAYPLDRVNVIDGGETYGLLIDGLTLVFTGQESYAAFNGVEVAYDGSPSYKEVITASGAMVVPITMSASGSVTGNVLIGTVQVVMTAEGIVNETDAGGAMSVPISVTGLSATVPITITGLTDTLAIAFTGSGSIT